MAKKLKNIFLSASIPLPDRDDKFYYTADIIAIRDAVRALATFIIPSYKLIWGGHPSITPLVRSVVESLDGNIQDHVEIYQSEFFKKDLPEDNAFFGNIVMTGIKKDRESSLLHMRKQMICDNYFVAGVFIGGMEGVIDEYKIFKNKHPEALLIPLATTGAAARMIYTELDNSELNILNDSYTYLALFNSLFDNYVKER
ncbi:MAG: hypothetical protein WC155_02125 [Candidatus Cloacimonadales bacterium]